MSQRSDIRAHGSSRPGKEAVSCRDGMAVRIPIVSGASIVSELRTTRRRRRLGELEWFEVAYRVYLAALVGGVAFAWLSGLVDDAEVTASDVANVVTRGPAWLGLIAVAAVALGLRSGSDGGPISLEVGDARFLMMAPVPRRSVLLRPVVQRMRTMAFGGALVGAIAGQLASRRLPGSAGSWTLAGTAAGVIVGLAFVAVAVLAHALAVPRWAATTIAVVLTAWQAAAAVWEVPGPADRFGSLTLWGMRQHAADLIVPAVVVMLALVALVVCDRLRLEPLTRRADLVSQLHFAVTMQDLRTVVLLRRQLRGERPRPQPWVHIGSTSPAAAVKRPARSLDATRGVWQRDLRGLARYPSSRLVRMALLATIGGFAAVALERGTTPAMVVVGVVCYLLGLEAIEPLSQEIDHPDLSDGVPKERPWLLVRHLAAPAVALVPFAAVAAVVVTMFDTGHAAAAFALAVPIAWAGACGAVVSVVRDAPNPAKQQASAAATAVPPEFAGFTSSFRFLLPVVVSTIASLTILAMREDPSAAQAVRLALLDALVIVATTMWVLRRDRWSAAWQRLLEGGRQAQGAPNR